MTILSKSAEVINKFQLIRGKNRAIYPQTRSDGFVSFLDTIHVLVYNSV